SVLQMLGRDVRSGRRGPGRITHAGDPYAAPRVDLGQSGGPGPVGDAQRDVAATGAQQSCHGRVRLDTPTPVEAAVDGFPPSAAVCPYRVARDTRRTVIAHGTIRSWARVSSGGRSALARTPSIPLQSRV